MVLTFTSKITKRENLTEDVVFFSLTAPENFSFKAGQFVMLKMVKGKETKLRAYSLLNPPSEKGKIDLCIKLLPGGFASEIFRKTKVGAQFEIKGPFGEVVFDEKSPHPEHWFVSVGCGVVPFHSIIKEYVGKFPKKKFCLIYGTKMKKDLLFYDEFNLLEKKYPNFKYYPILSRENWEGKTGRVQSILPEEPKNKIFYLCGLKEMIQDVKQYLLSKGVKQQDIKS